MPYLAAWPSHAFTCGSVGRRFFASSSMLLGCNAGATQNLDFMLHNCNEGTKLRTNSTWYHIIDIYIYIYIYRYDIVEKESLRVREPKEFFGNPSWICPWEATPYDTSSSARFNLTVVAIQCWYASMWYFNLPMAHVENIGSVVPELLAARQRSTSKALTRRSVLALFPFASHKTQNSQTNKDKQNKKTWEKCENNVMHALQSSPSLRWKVGLCEKSWALQSVFFLALQSVFFLAILA